MATDELAGDELDAVLDELTRKLERVRILYEQFFLGTEKLPPYQAQKDVVRIIYRLQRAKLKGASGKFRAQSLMQRYSVHKAYWARTIREIEEGRYKRQTFRAHERQKQQERRAEEDPLTAADHLAIRMIKDIDGEEAAAKAEEERRKQRQAAVEDAAADFMNQLAGGTEPGSAVVSAPEPPKGPASSRGRDRRPPPELRGMSADEVAAKADKLKEMRQRMRTGEEAIQRRREAAENRPAAPDAGQSAPAPDVDRQVYDRLVAAKRGLNQDTGALSYDAVKASLEKQRAKLRQKHDCARVDFDVVVKDGNAFLKPIPVKDA